MSAIGRFRTVDGVEIPVAPLWLLAIITFCGTFAMHIFVPALPIAATDLGVGAAAMQTTISIYILGLAVGQLIYGPLADRFGRRKVLMCGIVIYTCSGLAAALAPDAQALITARLFQALGGCSGLVLGRAMVRDTSTSDDAVKRLALMNMMVMLGPGLAPLLGGLLANTLGWRSIFFALCVLGIANFLLAWRLLPETGKPRPKNGPSLLQDYKKLLRSKRFLLLTLGGGCATTSMYAFIASAPFIFVHDLHRPASEVGPYLALLVCGVWGGSFTASRLITRVPVRKMLIVSNALSVLATFVMLGATLTGNLSVPLVIGTLFFFTLGSGTASPAALSEAISVNPNVVGSASGLYGFGQMAVGAICTTLAGLGNNPALGVTIVMATAGVIAQLSFWNAGRERVEG
jgi:DHA1 family bicyclomycin/chloramphenicol resistance-like MFS transporter